MKSGSLSAPKGRQAVLKWSVLVAFAAVCVAVDLATKHAAEQQLSLGETHRILPFLTLERTANSGVAFGLLGGRGLLIIVANVVALLVVGLYVNFERRALLAGMGGGLIVGGSLGNMVQRLSSDGHVTDFVKFPHWPNYNMADVFIFVGIAAIFIGLVWEAVRVWRAGRQAPLSR